MPNILAPLYSLPKHLLIGFCNVIALQNLRLGQWLEAWDTVHSLHVCHVTAEPDSLA